jgi:hypothetical protein
MHVSMWTWNDRPRLVYAIAVLTAIAVGVALRINTLNAGFGSDDYMEYAMLKGVYPVPRSPLDLFNFSDGSTQEVIALREYGTIPWWSHPNFRLAMMRPLSSALIVLDYTLFGSNLAAFHLHSLCWWAFLVLCAALVLRELFPLPVAAMAVFLFAIDESHTLPVTWLANRNAIVSLSLGFLGLWGHVCWRRGRGLGFALLSVCALALALLAGEWTSPIFGYLFAYEVWGARDALWRRFCSLIPAGFLGVSYVALQWFFKYASANSNVYLNPFLEPRIFLFESLRRIPIFCADLILSVPTYWGYTGSPLRRFFLSLKIFNPTVWRAIPNWHYWHILIGVIAGVIAWRTIRWAMRDQPVQQRDGLRWLLIGALISLLPMVSSFTSSRSSLPAVVGFSAACAFVLVRAFQLLRGTFRQGPRYWPRKALLALTCICYLHIVNASLRTITEVSSRVKFQNRVENWIDRADIDDKKIAAQDVYFMNGLEHTTVFFGPFVRYFRGHPMPRSWRVLNAAARAQDVYRIAPNELEISVLGGPLLAGPLEVFYRAARFPYKLGDTVSLRGLKARISRLRDGKPQRVRFTFDKPLEDPCYVFLRFSQKGLERFTPPAVGKSARLPRPMLPKAKKTDLPEDQPVNPTGK